MEMAEIPEVKWLRDVEKHDYPAAISYLSILHNEDKAKEIVNSLKKAPIVRFKAKDIFRASRLSLLGVSSSHVEKDRKKIFEGKRLSPLLLVRAPQFGKVVIADGYHRLCAIYSLDEDALIRCKIV
jgi:hypothetical protein